MIEWHGEHVKRAPVMQTWKMWRQTRSIVEIFTFNKTNKGFSVATRVFNGFQYELFWLCCNAIVTALIHQHFLKSSVTSLTRKGKGISFETERASCFDVDTVPGMPPSSDAPVYLCARICCRKLSSSVSYISLKDSQRAGIFDITEWPWSVSIEI